MDALVQNTSVEKDYLVQIGVSLKPHAHDRLAYLWRLASPIF